MTFYFPVPALGSDQHRKVNLQLRPRFHVSSFIWFAWEVRKQSRMNKRFMENSFLNLSIQRARKRHQSQAEPWLFLFLTKSAVHKPTVAANNTEEGWTNKEKQKWDLPWRMLHWTRRPFFFNWLSQSNQLCVNKDLCNALILLAITAASLQRMERCKRKGPTLFLMTPGTTWITPSF